LKTEENGVCSNVPLDSKARHAGLLCKNVATNLLDDGLGRRVGLKLLVVILVVDVVSDTNELATIVGAAQKDNSDSNDLGIGNALRVGGVGLKNEFVDTDRNGSHQQSIELLIILIA
jgi:hypothetical protein